MSEARDDLPPGMSFERDPKVAAHLRKFRDFWLWFNNQRDLKARYADRVVVVQEREVIGEGDTIEEAEQDARRRAAERGAELPPLKELIVYGVPAINWLESISPSPHVADQTSVPAPTAEDSK
jgi:hypothetical protein